MNPALIVLIVIAVVLVVAFIVLTILGKKAQKRKEEQDEQIAAASQTVNMLIIDKKRMKLRMPVSHSRLLSRHQSLCAAQSCLLSRPRSDQES